VELPPLVAPALPSTPPLPAVELPVPPRGAPPEPDPPGDDVAPPTPPALEPELLCAEPPELEPDPLCPLVELLPAAPGPGATLSLLEQAEASAKERSVMAESPVVRGFMCVEFEC
jgi:hypothetical protein